MCVKILAAPSMWVSSARPTRNHSSCSQTLGFDLRLVTEIAQIHFTAVHISKLTSTKLPEVIAVICFWYFIFFFLNKGPYLEICSFWCATYDKAYPHFFLHFSVDAVKHMKPETSCNGVNDNSTQRAKINNRHHCCNISLIFLSFTLLEWTLELIHRYYLERRM